MKMRNCFRFTLGIVLVTGAALAQTPPKTFEVASVKVAAPMDMQKMAADAAAGKMPKIGMHVNPGRVEFDYLDLKNLISMAYKLKVYQVSGPDWLANTRFDIIATFPKGATRDDIPEMLRALLKDRLKVEAHMENKEHAVLALVVAKGGPKLVESKEAPVAIDETVPLKDGEMQSDTIDGPVRQTVDMKTGSGLVDMGLKGKMKFSMDRGNTAPGAPPDLNAMALHFDAKQMTMAGLVELLSQFSSQMGGGGGGKQIVDMTGLTGHYDVNLSIPFAELIAIAKAAGMDVPNLPGVNTAGPAAASDPTGQPGMFASLSAYGLKLEGRKTAIDQLVVDHAEKTPTEN
jgi:uncharacterized protein (TIGR03435 family)